MIEQFSQADLKKLYLPPKDSHKGQNGKLMIIGGSKLFHAASLWSLKIASRIVDMVYYSSVDENNQIVQKAKNEFRDGIVIKRSQIESYIDEADCVLIGPGLPRLSGQEEGDDDTKELTEGLLKKYPHKRWVIDGGSLQTIDPSFIPKNAILTPHVREFETLFGAVILNEGMHQTVRPEVKNPMGNSKRAGDSSVASSTPVKQASSFTTFSPLPQNDKSEGLVSKMAEKYNCTILLKRAIDIVCDATQCVKIEGGNAGMTKGGTGDVLAGLIAALYCKNDAFLSASAGSYINKKAGEELYKRVGYYFNASDLADEIPKVMKDLRIK